jgi:acyl-CoA thioester hydrolase
MIGPLKLQIRFRDMDSLGHVNNAVYLSYLEVARMHFLEPYLGNDFAYATEGFLLARNEIDYKLPLKITDEAYVDLWTSRIGRRSFDFSYKIFNGDKVWCEAKSVLVSFNTILEKATEIHPNVMKAIKALER